MQASASQTSWLHDQKNALMMHSTQATAHKKVDRRPQPQPCHLHVNWSTPVACVCRASELIQEFSENSFLLFSSIPSQTYLKLRHLFYSWGRESISLLLEIIPCMPTPWKRTARPLGVSLQDCQKLNAFAMSRWEVLSAVNSWCWCSLINNERRWMQCRSSTPCCSTCESET